MTAKRLLQLAACALATACAKQAAPAATGCGGDADCGGQQICDQAGHPPACKDVTVASVEITSPAANSFAGLQLQTTATARAPGGVNGVDFQVRSASGTVLAHAAGVAAPAGSSNFAATVTLNNPAIVDGNANLVAVESYPTGLTKDSAPLPIKIDLTPPAFSSGTTTPAWLGPATPAASIKVTVTDSASGVDASSVKLTLVESSHAPYTAVVDSSNGYTFTVPMADLGIPTGNSGTVHFRLDAKDKVGNAAPSLTAQAFEAIQVDLVAPTAAFTSDAAYTSWHAASESVTVSGTANDAESGLVGGAAKVALTGGDGTIGRLDQPGTLSSSSFSVAANLGSLTFGATQEGAFAIHVAVTDQAGNTRTIDGNLNVDNVPPQISNIKITTPADYTNAANRAYYAASSGSLTVTATIADAGAGVKASRNTPCLYVTGDTTCYSGALQSGGTPASGTYSFSLPRSAGANKAGDTPITFTIQAEDTLASKTTAADQVHHKATSQLQSVYFDNVAPTIAIIADNTWYARTVGSTGVTITVHATITDAGSGLKGSTISMTHSGGTVPGVPGSGNDWTFALPATNLPQGTEGTISGFTITASDNIGNTATTLSTDPNAKRNVDDVAPSVTNLDIYTGINDPGTSGVHYPTAVTGTTYNTGYDGKHYLYNDALHIKGTITDNGAGLFASSLKYRVDGMDASGIAVQGTAQTLAGSGCTTDFAKTCSFDIPSVALQGVTFGQSAGAMTLVLLAEDAAAAGDGSSAHHIAAPSSTAIAVTRFWWSMTVAPNATVSGLALHPNGDVITTSTSNTIDSVVAVYNNGPFQNPTAPLPGQHWGFGTLAYGTSNLGAVSAAPAIGVGTAGSGATSNAPIYIVADSAHDILALNPADGTLAWKCGKSNVGQFKAAPAVKTIPNPSGPGTIEYVTAASVSNNRLYLAQLGDATAKSCNQLSVALPGGATFLASATTLLNDKAYVASNIGVHQIAVASANPTSVNTYGNGIGDFYGVAAGGGFLFAGSSNSSVHTVYQFDETLGSSSGYTKDLGTNHFSAGQVVLDAGKNAIVSSGGDRVLKRLSFTNGGAISNLTGALPRLPHTPLIGSDNRFYLGENTGEIDVLNADGSLAWNDTTTVPNDILAAPTMDCNGHLFVASQDTIYAFITDAQGLANTPWPKYQRDGRNSGNADATTQWGVRTAPGTAGCVQ